MILHIVKCEMCESKFKFDPMSRLYGDFAPPEWLVVYRMKDMQAQEGWHFCSKDCLKKWVKDEPTYKMDENAQYVKYEELGKRP